MLSEMRWQGGEGVAEPSFANSTYSTACWRSGRTPGGCRQRGCWQSARLHSDDVYVYIYIEKVLDFLEHYKKYHFASYPL